MANMDGLDAESERVQELRSICCFPTHFISISCSESYWVPLGSASSVHSPGKKVHFVTADVGGSGVLENADRRVIAKPKMDTSSVLASESSVFLEGQTITKQAQTVLRSVGFDLSFYVWLWQWNDDPVRGIKKILHSSDHPLFFWIMGSELNPPCPRKHLCRLPKAEAVFVVLLVAWWLDCNAYFLWAVYSIANIWYLHTLFLYYSKYV